MNGQFVDLNTIFLPNTGSKIGYNTGFDVCGNDLQNIFAPYVAAFYTATGTYTLSSDSSWNTILTYTGTGTFTLNKSIPSSVNYIAIGGGGGGGSNTTANISGSAGGGGGGGGKVLSGTITPSLQSLSNISIGTGGTATLQFPYTSTPGTPTTITGTGFTSVTATGGGAGQTNTGGLAGSGGTGGSGTNNGGANGSGTTINAGNGVTVPGFATYAGGGGAASGSNGSGGGGIYTFGSSGGQGTFYGAGGGGATAYYQVFTPAYVGGNGANGAVIIYFNI